MYALISTGGKQYKVQEGDVIRVEKLDAEEGEEIIFDQVLAANDDQHLKVGSPIIEGASVAGKVLSHGKGKKIIVFKYKAKKNYRRRRGHRQPFTEVKINKIQL